MQQWREVSNGLRSTLTVRRVTFPEVAEWIGMERLCCPFLNSNGS
jgi:hypothetical protein